jgi:hypothetical protein
MFILNGQPFDITLPQLIDDTQFPPGWFFDLAQRNLHDIIQVPDPVPPAITSAQRVALGGFNMVHGAWQALWQVTDKTPDELGAEAAAMAMAITAAVQQCYVDTDAITINAVGARIEEYRQAEADARAFAAAGYEGETTSGVSSYALYNPTGEVQSNQWAADKIIANADAYRQAQEQMRAKRFEYQARMRGAMSLTNLADICEGWNLFIAGIRSALEE